jgi:hypothetical protein
MNDLDFVGDVTSSGGDRVGLVFYQLLSNVGSVVSYDSSGAQLWTRTWASSSGGATPRALAFSGEELWAGGYFSAAVNVDAVAGNDFTPTGSGTDLLFVKYSPTGALLAGQAFNCTGNSRVTSLSSSPDGGILATGNYTATLFFGGFAAPAVGSGDAFLVKLNPSTGAALWSRKPGGPQSDSFNGVTTSGCGDVFAVGSYRSSNSDFGGGSLPFSGSSSSIDNGVLAKYRP